MNEQAVIRKQKNKEIKNQLQIAYFDIACPKLNKRYTFAFVSDLHLFPNKPIVGGTQSIHPDAVLVGGDFIQSKTNIASGIDFLKTIVQYYPVYCSSGKEHDFDERLCHRIEETGAVFLRNQSILFKEINIGGLNTLPHSDKTD